MHDSAVETEKISKTEKRPLTETVEKFGLLEYSLRRVKYKDKKLGKGKK